MLSITKLLKGNAGTQGSGFVKLIIFTIYQLYQVYPKHEQPTRNNYACTAAVLSYSKFELRKSPMESYLFLNAITSSKTSLWYVTNIYITQLKQFKF